MDSCDSVLFPLFPSLTGKGDPSLHRKTYIYALFYKSVLVNFQPHQNQLDKFLKRKFWPISYISVSVDIDDPGLQSVTTALCIKKCLEQEMFYMVDFFFWNSLIYPM